MKCIKQCIGENRVRFRSLQCRLLAGAVFLVAFGSNAQENIRPDYNSIVPGLDYAHIQTTNWNNGDPWSIHIARLDRSQKDLHLDETLAHGEIFGTAIISNIAKGFPKEKGQPLAMINAGFCIRTAHPYRGAPRGMVITDGELVSSPALTKANYTFWVNEDGAMHFGTFQPAFKATLPDGTAISIGLNNQCMPEDVVLFTHMLGKNTRATNNLEFILENPQQKQLSWSVGESYTMRIKAINYSGNTALSNRIAVLSFGSQAAAKATSLRAGDSIKVGLKTSPEVKDVVAATHVIFPVVHKGEPLEKFDASGPIVHRNPRTAIGFNDRYFYMVVVDGRKKELSMGMNPRELAEFMAQLGCTEAANLDGGGSSTFWLDGSTRNTVAGSRERDRADALVIVKRTDKKETASNK